MKFFKKSESKKYIYGSRENIDLVINIENSKEDAFEAQCHLTLPLGVDYVKAFFNQNNIQVRVHFAHEIFLSDFYFISI